jgi:alcohol dehydrogenase class IV
MRFEFAAPQRILFGTGTRAEVHEAAHKLGGRPFVVYGQSMLADPFLEQLSAKGLSPLPHRIKGEPTVPSVLEAIRAARAGNCDLVIGIGGGSVLDTGKAVAALLTNEGNLIDYLEIVGVGRPLEKASAPYIAIPTTAGTGSEVTRNAVIAVPENKVKVSLRSPYMLPRLAVVDPELTYSLPPEITASTGMDALTQCIEPFVCNSPNPLVDTVCRDGITRAARSLRQAYMNGKDASAREDLALASLFGGMALANAKLGAVHGLAGVLGGMYSAPHGTVCARLLPFVMEANLRALRKRERNSPALERYAEVAVLLTGNALARIEDGARWVQGLTRSLNIPSLVMYGVEKNDFPVIVAQAQKASSMKGNPITLTEEDLTNILEKAI